MIASRALRPACCEWHSTTHAASEHLACKVCDRPMPLLMRAFRALDIPPEPICARCAVAIWIALSRLRPSPWIPRFLRAVPVPRRAPGETFEVNRCRRNPAAQNPAGGTRDVRTEQHRPRQD